MGAITWQNVNGASLADAAQPMAAASQTMNNAFSGLQGVIAGHEAIDAANQANAKTNNTQDYLDKVSQLGKTPEKLQAAIADGSLDVLHASYGANIDHAATRGYAENLLANRYAQSKAAGEYADYSTDRSQQPLVDQINSLTANDKTDEAQALLAQHPEIRLKAALYGSMKARDEKTEDRDQNNETHVWAGQMQDANIKHMNNQDANSSASLGLQRQGLGLQQQTLDMQKQDHNAAAQAAIRAELAAAGGNSTSTQAGQAAITSFISTLPAGQQDNARLFASGEMAKPGMTVPVLQQALMGMNTHLLLPNMIARSISSGEADQGLKSDASKAQVLAVEANKQALYQQYEALRNKGRVLNGLTPMGGSPAPGKTTMTPNPFMPGKVVTAGGEHPLVPSPNQTGDYSGPGGSFQPGPGGTPAGFIPTPGMPIPDAPAPKIWIGKSFVTNPQYAQWDAQFGELARAQQNADGLRLISRMEGGPK